MPVRAQFARGTMGVSPEIIMNRTSLPKQEIRCTGATMSVTWRVTGPSWCVRRSMSATSRIADVAAGIEIGFEQLCARLSPTSLTAVPWRRWWRDQCRMVGVVDPPGHAVPGTAVGSRRGALPPGRDSRTWYGFGCKNRRTVRHSALQRNGQGCQDIRSFIGGE